MRSGGERIKLGVLRVVVELGGPAGLEDAVLDLRRVGPAERSIQLAARAQIVVARAEDEEDLAHRNGWRWRPQHRRASRRGKRGIRIRVSEPAQLGGFAVKDAGFRAARRQEKPDIQSSNGPVVAAGVPNAAACRVQVERDVVNGIRSQRRRQRQDKVVHQTLVVPARGILGMEGVHKRRDATVEVDREGGNAVVADPVVAAVDVDLDLLEGSRVQGRRGSQLGDQVALGRAPAGGQVVPGDGIESPGAPVVVDVVEGLGVEVGRGLVRGQADGIDHRVGETNPPHTVC